MKSELTQQFERLRGGVYITAVDATNICAALDAEHSERIALAGLVKVLEQLAERYEKQADEQLARFEKIVEVKGGTATCFDEVSRGFAKTIRDVLAAYAGQRGQSGGSTN